MKKMKLTPVIFCFYAMVFLLIIAAASAGSRAVTVINQNSNISNPTRIVIDAGHGGEDGGASSCTGILESQINLDIALRLDDLMHMLGYPTIMIRRTDCSVYTAGNTIAQKKVSDLKERVRMVNNAGNAILVSIHQNHFSDSQYSGAQVFYSNSSESRQLAETMQNIFVQTLNPGSNRKSKKAENIYLMNNISCAGVLVECGFLSNVQEEAKLRSEAYQKKVCCVIASALSVYQNT